MIDHSRPVLVTGGAGFAGSYVVRALSDAGFGVVVLDTAAPRPESRFVLGDAVESTIFETGSVELWTRVMDVVGRHRPTAILHLGAILDIPLLDKNPMLAYQVNVGGTMNILEAGRLHGVDRVVVFSTIAVIPKVAYLPIDGSHPTITSTRGPLGAYGAAKLASEAFSFAYQQSFGLDTRIIRPSALYGFGMSWLAPNYAKNIIEPALEGQAVRLQSGGSMPRDYCHVEDLASLSLAVLEGGDDADRIFYAGTGRPLRTGGDVARIVTSLIPGADIEVADVLTDVDADELPMRGVLSIENARTQLGWEPRYGALEDGVARYIERYRDFTAAGGVPSPRPASSLGAPGGS